MKLYGGIDLHSNHCVVALLDEQDRVVYQKRRGNDVDYLLEPLAPYQAEVQGRVVESTFNGYWRVDGLQAAGYAVHLANTAAIQQYAGLTYSDDSHDARWLAHLLRLGLLPEGYIYPQEARAVRDLLRKRSPLVRQRTSQVLSIENLVARHTGRSLSGHEVKRLTLEAVQKMLPDPRLALAVASQLVVGQTLDDLIGLLEKQGLEAVRLAPAFQPLRSIPGVGRVLALTLRLETGAIRRFPQGGNFASYCRCVGSAPLSNGKRKGQGNTPNANQYLAWAFIEAANVAVRYAPDVKRFYQRQRARTPGRVALKAVAHKLGRACYYGRRDQVPFVRAKAFA